MDIQTAKLLRCERRRAAPGREGPLGGQRTTRCGERGGHIIQDPLRQDEAIGSHHHHIGVGIGNGLACSGRVFGVFAIQAQAARLRHGHSVLQRKLLYRRRVQLHAAPGRAVRLGQHQHDGVAAGVQPFQRNAGKFGRARKDDSHTTLTGRPRGGL